MSDLIERKDAIDYFVTNIGVVDADGYAVDDYDERVKIWTERFSGIPSAEPERRWIPVTESLPKANEEVLTTYIVNGNTKNQYIETASYIEGKEGYFLSPWDEFNVKGTKIVAWMPLPEPYRKEN